MNQNNPNQVPMQNGLMNALMGYLQPQAQVQGGAAPMQTFPQFQQQQPVLWPGWQPQGNVAVPGGAQYMQQWAAQPAAPQQQAVPAAAAQPPSANEIAAAVAAAVQPLLQDKHASPVGSKANDETILIEALRKAKADGLTPRQGLEKLHNVSEFRESSPAAQVLKPSCRSMTILRQVTGTVPCVHSALNVIRRVEELLPRPFREAVPEGVPCQCASICAIRRGAPPSFHISQSSGPVICV